MQKGSLASEVAKAPDVAVKTGYGTKGKIQLKGLPNVAVSGGLYEGGPSECGCG